MNELLRVRLLDLNFVDHIVFTPVPKGQKGDLALNFFIAAKQMGKSPRVLAEETQQALENTDFIEKTELVGVYLNVYFTAEAYFANVLALPLHLDLLADRKMVLEYSGPNTNKPLHLGHMRNHALGLSMVGVLRSVGAAVSPVNIVNDRGVHICKSMLAYQLFGKESKPEMVKSDHFVGGFYVKYNEYEKENVNAKQEIQQMLQQWEDGDENVKTLWQKMNSWALAGHKQTYSRQGVTFEKEYKESDYYLRGKDIAEEGLAKNVFQKREDGAIVIDLTDEKLDEKVILRSDGTSIYLTQDLAVAVARNEDFSPTDLIYTVADEQNYHFQVLFACLQRLGLLNKDHLTHLSYGLVHLPSGRMKSREGTVVDADNLMNELSGKAKQLILERNSDISEKKAHETAEIIMDAAWKFALLRVSPRKSMTFNPEESLSFEGATGPYVQYACVRIKSLFLKAGFAESHEFNDISYHFYTENEKEVANVLMQYPEALKKAALQKNPTYLITFLLELAQIWSKYYANNPILVEDEAERVAKLALGQKVLQVLTKGMHILGMRVPESM